MQTPGVQMKHSLDSTHQRCSHWNLCKIWIPLGSARFCNNCQTLFDIASESFEKLYVTPTDVVRRVNGLDYNGESQGKIWPDHLSGCEQLLFCFEVPRFWIFNSYDWTNYFFKLERNLAYDKFIP